MGKTVWFLKIVKILMWAVALGVGVWYLSSSLSGAAITYTSMDKFLGAAGVQNGDIATVNGCFMCSYASDLFGVIGNATYIFWDKILEHIWILIVLGLGLFVLIHTIKYIMDKAKDTGTLEPKEHDFDVKEWLEPIWKQTLRVLLVAVFIGSLDRRNQSTGIISVIDYNACDVSGGTIGTDGHKPGRYRTMRGTDDNV